MVLAVQMHTINPGEGTSARQAYSIVLQLQPLEPGTTTALCELEVDTAMFTENTIRSIHLNRVHDIIQLYGRERYAPNGFEKCATQK